MKKVLFFTAVCALLYAGQVSALTVTFDADLGEWVGADVANLGTRGGPDNGSYIMLSTSDATNLYLGMERGATERYLGDTDLVNDSFFVAIDVDGVANSGATAAGYGNVSFGGTYRPDLIYYFEGGPSWYQKTSWNGTGWNWDGWSDSGVIYGNPGWGDDDEFAFALDSIGGSDGQVRIWAWMTREDNNWVESYWNGESTDYGAAESPNLVDGIVLSIPEPATMVLLGLGSLAMLRRKK
jgi:hypothetical protein